MTAVLKVDWDPSRSTMLPVPGRDGVQVALTPLDAGNTNPSALAQVSVVAFRGVKLSLRFPQESPASLDAHLPLVVVYGEYQVLAGKHRLAARLETLPVRIFHGAPAEAARMNHAVLRSQHG